MPIKAEQKPFLDMANNAQRAGRPAAARTAEILAYSARVGPDKIDPSIQLALDQRHTQTAAYELYRIVGPIRPPEEFLIGDICDKTPVNLSDGIQEVWEHTQLEDGGVTSRLIKLSPKDRLVQERLADVLALTGADLQTVLEFDEGKVVGRTGMSNLGLHGGPIVEVTEDTEQVSVQAFALNPYIVINRSGITIL